VMERRKSEAARFRDFENDGDLTMVKRVGDDVADVANVVSRVEASGKLDKIGVDPYALGGILEALSEAGINEEKIIGVSQGWKLVGAIKTAERKLADGMLIHGGSAMMAWCVGNAKVEPKGNAIAGFAKIDPLMATFNAAHLMAANPESQKSFWETA
jgi:phage terminase large subunit-like protein